MSDEAVREQARGKDRSLPPLYIGLSSMSDVELNALAMQVNAEVARRARS